MRRAKPGYQVPFRAIVLGGTLGVSCTRNPLHAGPNSLPEGVSHSESTEHVALKVGSCAAGHREPGQVRKEAALSGMLRVPQGCLTGAGDSESTGRQTFEGRGTITLLRSRSESSVFSPQSRRLAAGSWPRLRLTVPIPEACLLEKCGFQLEGRMREAVQKEGRFTDLLLYGLLRDEH